MARRSQVAVLRRHTPLLYLQLNFLLSVLLLALAPATPPVAAEFALVAQLFQLQDAASAATGAAPTAPSSTIPVNNAKLAWPTLQNATAYRVLLNTTTVVADNVTGNTVDVYDLPVGRLCNLTVLALNTTAPHLVIVDMSVTVQVTPFVPPAGVKYMVYDNSKPSTATLRSDVYSKTTGLYYSYLYETAANGSVSRLVEQTSPDGYTFTGNKTVLTGSVLCAPANYSCKLERIRFRVNPTTGNIVMWAHFERAQDYALGWVAAAHKAPGDAQLTFDGAYAPLGHDSRDLDFFADDDGAAYVLSATNTNTDMNVYKLSADWTKVDALLATINKGGFREAPSTVKGADGWYYLFTSRASGWLPSAPQVVAAKSMAGPWPAADAAQAVANAATFGAQSGGVAVLAVATNPQQQPAMAMFADRWSSNWPTPGGPTRRLMLPVNTNGGFAWYHFFRSVAYSDNGPSRADQALFGIQAGRIVSVGKPLTASDPSAALPLANDGTSSDPDAVYAPKTVPFWVTVDLGPAAAAIAQVDLTFKMVHGSETFVQYTVLGSNDAARFDLLANMSTAIDVGFSAAWPGGAAAAAAATKYRYVRVAVDRVVNDVNNHEADFAAGVAEFTVYGLSILASAAAAPLLRGAVALAWAVSGVGFAWLLW
ncbi:glycosyl hydrolase [Zopfochytrium polystomum]|nr:glycosyl hydrolase [Zopfochytrium polystomum]